MSETQDPFDTLGDLFEAAATRLFSLHPIKLSATVSGVVDTPQLQGEIAITLWAPKRDAHPNYTEAFPRILMTQWPDDWDLTGDESQEGFYIESLTDPRFTGLHLYVARKLLPLLREVVRETSAKESLGMVLDAYNDFHYSLL